MSNKYLVNWSDIGIEGAETFGAKSAHAAYLEFIDENVHQMVKRDIALAFKVKPIQKESSLGGISPNFSN